MMLVSILLLACSGTITHDASPSSGTGDTTSSDADTGAYAGDSGVFYDVPEFPEGVSTLAGSDTMASQDGTQAGAAFSEPKAIAVDTDGQLVVVGGDGVVRSVDMYGVVQTRSFSGPQLTDVGGLAIDAAGAVYVSDSQQHCILRIQGGTSEVFAGDCGNPGMADGSNARFTRPRGMTFDAQGQLIVADSENMRIRSISPDGVVSTLAGIDSFSGPTEGSVSSATLYYPLDVAVHVSGDIYFSGLDNCIRRIHSDQVENVAGLCQNYNSAGDRDGSASDARFYAPFDIAFVDDDALLISDSFNDRLRIFSVTSQDVRTLTGSTPGYADGALSQALFEIPRGAAVDRVGNLYVADSINNRIRVIVY